MAIDFRIEKTNIRSVEARQRALAPLPAGQIRLSIARVALTANNVTYAASGDVLRYWSFFPCADNDGNNAGLVPVWGLASVLESDVAEVSVGEQIYGFFPLASHIDLTPDHIRATGFVDAASHRAKLPEIYNGYQRMVGPMGALDASMRDRLALLFPLFVTSFLIDDFLQESAWFDAKELVLTSASSKTAIGLAKLTAEREQRPTVVGLTSAANREFVESLGCYDRVVLYDDLAQGIGEHDAMLVDLAGNTDVRAGVHQRLGDRLRYSCAVGTSHWDQFRPTEEMPAGPKPVFFFAPAQSKKRRQEWGGPKLQQAIFESWFRLAKQSEQWLQVKPVSGPEAIIEAWQAVADGQASPAEGIILAFE